MTPLTSVAARLASAPRKSYFSERGWHVWCGSLIAGPEGDFFLFYSRWPATKGFEGWVTDSEIAVARSLHHDGPFVPVGSALPRAGGSAWDAHVTHNPAVIEANGRFYLYYMGNHGDGTYWDHRNHQRIGVAWADHPAGPWHRSEEPLIDVNPDSWSVLMTSNPTVTPTHDGRWLMIYKTVAAGPMPSGGSVFHAVALADDPLGPFTTEEKPIFTREGSQFPAEDPFVWKDGSGYRAILKDMDGSFTGIAPSLAEFESRDGINWRTVVPALVTRCEIPWEDGTIEPVLRLERPHLLFADSEPLVLRAAVLHLDGHSGNVGITIRAL